MRTTPATLAVGGAVVAACVGRHVSALTVRGWWPSAARWSRLAGCKPGSWGKRRRRPCCYTASSAAATTTAAATTPLPSAGGMPRRARRIGRCGSSPAASQPAAERCRHIQAQAAREIGVSSAIVAARPPSRRRWSSPSSGGEIERRAHGDDPVDLPVSARRPVQREDRPHRVADDGQRTGQVQGCRHLVERLKMRVQAVAGRCLRAKGVAEPQQIRRDDPHLDGVPRHDGAGRPAQPVADRAGDALRWPGARAVRKRGTRPSACRRSSCPARPRVPDCHVRDAPDGRPRPTASRPRLVSAALRPRPDAALG